MTRQARTIADSGVYHIMLRGNERKNIFQQDEDKQRFLDGVIKKQREIQFSVYAYCLMDNHIHLLMKSSKEDLASIMKGISVRYALFYNWKYNRVGHVFQDRFKSETIENDRYLLAAVRYIHNNPVKAGISKTPGSYRWSSYSQYAYYDKSGWVETDLILGMFGIDEITARKEFEHFSKEEDDFSFIDCHDDTRIRTYDEGKVYLTEYLQTRRPGLLMSQIKEDKLLRTEIIEHLRSVTNLSQRTIATILEVDKGVVERTGKNNAQ